jgi:hypothetical protein
LNSYWRWCKLALVLGWTSGWVGRWMDGEDRPRMGTHARMLSRMGRARKLGREGFQSLQGPNAPSLGRTRGGGNKPQVKQASKEQAGVFGRSTRGDFRYALINEGRDCLTPPEKMPPSHNPRRMIHFHSHIPCMLMLHACLYCVYAAPRVAVVAVVAPVFRATPFGPWSEETRQSRGCGLGDLGGWASLRVIWSMNRWCGWCGC